MWADGQAHMFSCSTYDAASRRTSEGSSGRSGCVCGLRRESSKRSEKRFIEATAARGISIEAARGAAGASSAAAIAANEMANEMASISFWS